jgi:hypothetical protein
VNGDTAIKVLFGRAHLDGDTGHISQLRSDEKNMDVNRESLPKPLHHFIATFAQDVQSNDLLVW